MELEERVLALKFDAHQPAYRRLFWDQRDCHLKQHCNGLLLLEGKWPGVPYVCNPATSRYARLPFPPTPLPCSIEGMFLAFDPAVSQHHRVFFFPTEKLQRYEEEQHGTSSRAKLPCWVDWEHTPLPNLFGEEPAAKVFHAFLFSSQTGRWESREFTPGRCASGHLYDVVTALRRRDQRTWWWRIISKLRECSI
uniref:Uncharacterized protein n=1 Tax=Aegilops tauschii TaxID=37682 RepID=M8B1I1_AEGTA